MFVESISGVCASLLQADAAVRDGRDRRGPGLQERLHRRKLHQGEDSKRSVHHHLSQVKLTQ